MNYLAVRVSAVACDGKTVLFRGFLLLSFFPSLVMGGEYKRNENNQKIKYFSKSSLEFYGLELFRP